MTRKISDCSDFCDHSPLGFYAPHKAHAVLMESLIIMIDQSAHTWYGPPLLLPWSSHAPPLLNKKQQNKLTNKKN